MKPKDLIIPFTWQERRPHIEDQVFYVPEYYDNYQAFTFPSWDDPSLFGNQNEVLIEYCSGNGNWILEKASKSPEKNWVAVEYSFDRLRKIWAHAKNKKLSNLIMVYGEAGIFTSEYIPRASVSEVFINFPDPWPKKRHEKNRLLNPIFIQELSRILKKSGKVTFVTDDEAYYRSTEHFFIENENFEKPLSSTTLIDYGNSFFDTLWRQQGKEIKYLQGIKKHL